MTTPSGEPIFPRLRPDEEPRRRPSTAVIATSALALILVIILAIVLVTRNTGASKDDLVKAAQQATDQAQAAQDAKDQKAAADKAVAAADKAATDAKAAADAVTAKTQADAIAAAAKAASDAAAAAAAAKAAAESNAVGHLVVPPVVVAPGPSSYPVFNDSGSGVFVRSDPGTATSPVGTVFGGQYVTLSCSTYGDQVGSTSVWDYIVSPVHGYVSDHYVHTGTNNPVVSSC